MEEAGNKNHSRNVFKQPLTYPEIVRFGDSGSERCLMLVAREQGVLDSEVGGARWSLDHPFLDEDAVTV